MKVVSLFQGRARIVLMLLFVAGVAGGCDDGLFRGSQLEVVVAGVSGTIISDEEFEYVGGSTPAQRNVLSIPNQFSIGLSALAVGEYLGENVDLTWTIKVGNQNVRYDKCATRQSQRQAFVEGNDYGLVWGNFSATLCRFRNHDLGPDVLDIEGTFVASMQERG